MISALKAWVANKSRHNRSMLLRDTLKPSVSMSILDLGGGKGRHFGKYYPDLKNVCVADFNPKALAYAKANYGFDTVRVDGSETLPFDDHAFELVFCSSVIEHVTGEKLSAIQRFKSDGRAFKQIAWGCQQAFAEEIRRISSAYYVQTPSRWFPVEVHSWIPLIGALPTHVQWWVIRIFNRFWPRRDENPDWSLLGYGEMKALFPDAVIYRERMFGFTKSYIAVRGPA